MSSALSGPAEAPAGPAEAPVSASADSIYHAARTGIADGTDAAQARPPSEYDLTGRERPRGCLAARSKARQNAGMSVEAVYLLRKDQPGCAIRELDDVRLLSDVVTLDGDTIPAGREGTVVAVWGLGDAFEVEFPEPMGALATVEAACIARIGRSVP
ncbi:DUF4926 domain-containing protein [Methylobacterium sp. J-026]|uniref:DUF4926 domain-containing protein n=1 Tax=Methylobacterium sp. J-026 TaxID=2836624 RepID=UPI001FB9368D|nr:DUF4926 domain-containing protein [Methylobacterium sp. J-026]MCJ2135939.1 DUF4926 domain-containing protein [Methylobacterium sp. J-026]